MWMGCVRSGIRVRVRVRDCFTAWELVGGEYMASTTLEFVVATTKPHTITAASKFNKWLTAVPTRVTQRQQELGCLHHHHLVVSNNGGGGLVLDGMKIIADIFFLGPYVSIVVNIVVNANENNFETNFKILYEPPKGCSNQKTPKGKN